MKKILLTGGSGFIGRNLSESFLKDKYALVAPTHAELDMADTAVVDTYFRKNKFDAVIHAATKPGHRNAGDLKDLLLTNLRMFENLERNKEHFGKLINLGSGAIYDISANNCGVKEEDIFGNMGKDDHSFCKYIVAKQIEKLPNFVDLNIFGIFGKYEDYSIRFISNVLCKALFNLPLTLRQNRRFSYLYVNDLAAILEFFIDNEFAHKSYNIVPDGYVALKEIAEKALEISGKKLEIKIGAEGYGLDYYGDNSRLKAEFPEVKFTPLETAMTELFTYYDSIKDNLDYNSLLIDK